MNIRLMEVEEALAELETVESGNGNKFQIIRKPVNERIRRNAKKWMSAGMSIPVERFPLLSKMMDDINNERDDLQMTIRRTR